MAKEHKKLYKAGKNWVVATLIATTITLLGGIGAYTAHADTTIENTQSIQAEGSNQSSQNNNSNNSVVLNQPVTTQSNSTVKNSQPVQNTPTTTPAAKDNQGKTTPVNPATPTTPVAPAAKDNQGKTTPVNPAEPNNQTSTSNNEAASISEKSTPNTFKNINGSTYYYDENGNLYRNQFYSNWGRTYYFGNDGARWDNRYMVRWGRAYYFGNDGALLQNQLRSINGINYWINSQGVIPLRNQFLTANENQLYYFDGNGDLVVNKFYHNWGHTYYFGPDGARYTDQFLNWNGKVYYFDNQGIMYQDQYYKNWGHTYYFGPDGARYTDQFLNKDGKVYYFDNQGIMYQDQYYKNWGHTYYFGPDGARYTDQFLNKDGKVYYFDNQGIMYQDQYYKNWGHTYYFGPDGARYTDQFLNKDGKVYYFDNQGIMYQNKFYKNWGHIYYFGNDGARYTDQWYKNWGHTYYYGNDGALVKGLQAINGKIYDFDNDGIMQTNMKNLVAKPQGNQLNIYNGNTVLKTLGPGTWENMAFAQDSSAINNINGYLSYTGWYRPYGTSQDGKTWYQTTAMDWRPLLMYIWPSKDVQAQFIKYFVNHGYENANYGLTKVSAAKLNKDTDATVLNTAAQNLRYVIEQSIATNKGTGKLANDINGFAATVPELSASSELSVQSTPNYKPSESGTVDNDQVIFVNNDSKDQRKGNTSYADSKYRLMNRTINNQTGNDNSDNSPELLIGNDIDNSNPVVQAENLNWEYFLLNYGKLMGYNRDGNFDGFRIDAADHSDADVLDQMGQLMNDMYHMKGNPQNANNHLSYNEEYHPGAAQMLNKKGNPQLYMDSGEFSTLENVLGRANNRDDISHLITNSIVNRQNDVTENEATPNWSFVTNHDWRKNLINGLIIKNHPGIAYIMGSAYKAEYANQAWQEFDADQKKTDKQYAQYNVPAQYAILLSNKDTVPQIYYGDLYNETAQYMQEKSIYYDAITTLMKARKQFVSGGQTMTKLGDNLIASVRYGKGVANANSEGTDSLSRTSGMAVIVGNNPQMAEQTISINMGRAHANEQYRNLLDTTDNGLTYNADGAENPETLTTDDNGILKVTVKGYSNPYVSGYLGVWVPVVSGNQDVTTSAATVSADSNKIFESNAALDSHMIYEDFSLYQPKPTSTENHAYNIIAQNAELFKNLGITDFWMAPAYTSGESRYNEGYSVTDRYNLGTNANPTKYGSGEELANAITALHSAGLKVQEDIVFNQMMGFPGQEAVTVTRTDNHGMQIYVNGKTYANQIYFAYTTGGGNGQETYGGKYLSELQSKYPDLFTTRAISTGVAPDPTTHITKWSAKYENGTSLQNIGIGLAVKLPNGEYAYLRSSGNKSFNTLLPSEISGIDL
ncbi:glycoside hydrolase family 70 protein [Limosilactobacillus mucosae]|uniref:glycoside hydrolase family 70 protein n=1 Tax=Limosilactobacillus mucosae TaxID=97478 RepID=UPI000FFB3C85|nr:glycoside hydrolase family 70 protein [Limosilactobacillus mucosae]RXA54887.1 glycosyl hydrolase family 70 [Limosilactobacillus mucosae]